MGPTQLKQSWYFNVRLQVSCATDPPLPSPSLQAPGNQLPPTVSLDQPSTGAAVARSLDTCMGIGAGPAAALTPSPPAAPPAHDAAGPLAADLLLSALGLNAPNTLLPAPSTAAAMAGGAGLAPAHLHGAVTAALATQRSLVTGGDSQAAAAAAAALQLQGGAPGLLSPGSIGFGTVVGAGLAPAFLASRSPAALLGPSAAALASSPSALPAHMLPLGMPGEALLPAAGYPLEVATN